MATAKQNFEHFVCRLYEPGRAMPADMRRLAMLCLQSFDEPRRPRDNAVSGQLLLLG